MAHDPNWQEKIPGQTLHHFTLLQVLLPEDRHLRLNNPEQFGHHGGHTSEMVRPIFSAAAFGSIQLLHPGGSSGGIELCRSKKNIGPGSLGQLSILGGPRGIFPVVRPLVKLSWVDVTADHHPIP